jgi:ribonuclease HII
MAPTGESRLPRAADSCLLNGMPDFAREKKFAGLVCGIDEAGRGPLAGPVVAAAVILDRRRLPRSLRDGLDDSKKLSAAAREEYAALLWRYGIIGRGAASVAEIDRINILQATLLAMARAVAALGVVPERALVDGNVPPPLTCKVETVVGGDGLSLSIAAASIIAKVTRDRLMRRLAARHPGYGWERNVGYATLEHRDALSRLGPTIHHRTSFAPVQLSLEFDSNFSL